MNRESYLRDITQMFLDDGFFLKLPDEYWTPFPDEEGRLSIRGKLGLMLPSVDVYAEMIEVQEGAVFPVHIHDHDHTIHVLDGLCFLAIGDTVCSGRKGETVYIPSRSYHSFISVCGTLSVLVVGHPKRRPSLWQQFWHWLGFGG